MGRGRGTDDQDEHGQISRRGGELQRLLAELSREIGKTESSYALLDLVEEYSESFGQQLNTLPPQQAFSQARALLLEIDALAAAAKHELASREQELRELHPHADASWAPGGLFRSDKRWKALERASAALSLQARALRMATRAQADRLGEQAGAALAELWRDEAAIWQRRQHEQWAAAHGLDWEEYLRAGAAHLQRLVDSSQLAIRIPEMAFASVLKQGRFKTQHEISRSRGYKDAGFREQVEHQLFGTPLNRKRPFNVGDRVIVDEDHRRFPGATGVVTAVENGTVEVDLDAGSWTVSRSKHRWSGGYARGPQRLQKGDLEHADLLDVPRPVYGYLTDPERDYDDVEGAVAQYGAVRVIVKDARRSSSTITFADSLDTSGAGRETEHHLAPSPSASVDIFCARQDPLEITDVYDGRPAGFFTEVQYQGGLSADDIAEVHFTRRLPTAAVAKELARRGIPWRAPSGERFDPQTHKLSGGWLLRPGDDPYADVPPPAMSEQMKAVEKTANYLRNPQKISGTTSTREPARSMYLNDQLLYERARELEDEHPLCVPAELDAFALEQLPPDEQLRQLEAARARGARVSKRLVEATRRWAEGAGGRPLPLPRYVFGHGEESDRLEQVWERATPPERIAMLNVHDARKKADERARELAGERVYSGRSLWRDASYGQWQSRWVSQVQEDAAVWQGAPVVPVEGGDGEPSEQMVEQALQLLLEKARRNLSRHEYRLQHDPSSRYEREQREQALGVVERAEAALAGSADPLAGLKALRAQAIEDLQQARESYRRHLQRKGGSRQLVVDSLQRAHRRLAELNERLELPAESEQPYEAAPAERD